MRTMNLHHVEAVAFDAVHTLFQSRGGSRAAVQAKLFRNIAGVRINAKELDTLIGRLRGHTPRLPEIPMSDYWTEINAQAIHARRPKMRWPRARKLGRRIHKRIYEDLSLYEVTDDMRALLVWVAERTTIAIASNQEPETLAARLRTVGLAELFGKHVYTSGAIGYPKPTKEFWEAVRRGLNLESYRGLAHVGNSVENDISIARDGSPVALLDVDHRIPELKVSGVHIVQTIADLKIWLQDLLPSTSQTNGMAVNGRPMRSASNTR